MIDFTEAELLILGRLTGDPELLAVCKKVDEQREKMWFEKMRGESQSGDPSTPLLIQYGSKAAEAEYGVKRYQEEAREAMRRRSQRRAAEESSG